MKLISGFILLLLFWAGSAIGANTLNKVKLEEDDFFLLDIAIDRQVIAGSVDAYKINNTVVIAIEPLFDSLKLKYQLTESQLKVWKDDDSHVFTFSELAIDKKQLRENMPQFWANDGYFQFVDLRLFESLFGLKVNIDLSRQVVTLGNERRSAKSDSTSNYLFPVQKLELLSERRQSNRFYNSVVPFDDVKHAITIADQYSLVTPPQGRVNLSANLVDGSFNGSVQLVSDLLYHSANLTLSQSNDTDLGASLSFSRFKSSPDDLILGLFDSYRLGDVSGVSSNLTTGSNAGIGIVFQRMPDNFRRKNLEVTLDELAPPGWDAELFRSGVFLDSRVVPADGRLIYENVELFYGLNDFEIRLYGPYGEEEIISNRVTVRQNPLSKGQMAYSINALDKNHRLLNDESNAPYQITNFGGSFDYGITDRWQLGFSFASIDSEQQFYSIKNALSFNNFLFENDFSVNQDGSYAQKTSVIGSLFNKDSYSLVFESAKDFESEKISAFEDDYYSFSANYSIPTYIGLTRFRAGVQENNSSSRSFFSNQLSQNIGKFNFTHTLTYSTFNFLNSVTENPSDNLFGNLGISMYGPSYLLNANIDYDPDQSDPILASSSIRARKTIEDPYGNKHYIQARYFPLSDSGLRWSLSHNVAWLSEDYQMTLSSSYDSRDEWNVNLGLRFFLGYDHRNNRFIMDREYPSGSATLDVHTYLDRQLNGVPDVLDYNLPDVTFTGSRRWKDYKSNQDGRTILPGVYANSEFAFAGKWQDGSATYNQDYVVYTHPGAYVDVNMPFYLVTDLTGFVVRQQNGQEIGLRSVEVQLINAENEIQETTETDLDGYYEFLNLTPNKYTVRVAQDYLRTKGLTGDVVGINVATNGKGGYVELPILVLQRQKENGTQGDELISRYILNDDNVDALVWSEDAKVGRNYFTLPIQGKTKLSAKYSLTHVNPQEQSESADEGFKEQENKIDNSNIVESKIGQENILTKQSVLRKLKRDERSLPTINIAKKQNIKPDLKAPLNESSNKLNSEKSIVLQNASNTWVIQFSANKLPINIDKEVNKFSNIGQLYEAVKTNVAGVSYFCVISKSFDSKQAAIDALELSGLTGWVNKSSNYENATKIN